MINKNQILKKKLTTSYNKEISDHALYQLCKRYGAQALEARRKFAGLLPEVYRRRLYEKKGYVSIFEFAAKLSGMSMEQVNNVLRLEKRFEDKPYLKKALVFGEVSANKLARVASIATAENQQELANRAKILSNRALEVFVKDVKNENQNGLNKTKNDPKSVHVHSNPQESLPDVNLLEHMSIELQKELIMRHKKGIDINKLLLELLKKHDLEIAREKEKIAADIHSEINCQQKCAQKQDCSAKKPSRYIPAKIRKILQKEHGTKCSIPNCQKPASIIHHTQRFALTNSHNPAYLAPLCKEHHQIAHSIDIKHQINRFMRRTGMQLTGHKYAW